MHNQNIQHSSLRHHSKKICSIHRMEQPPQHSARAILTRLLSIPSNRSCADCKSALIDSSQVHASYSPSLSSTTKDTPTIQQQQQLLRPEHHFLRHHHAFAPSNKSKNNKSNAARVISIPELEDLPVDPAIAAAGVIPHGVFVCGMCAAAHNLLGKDVCIVKAVQDVTAWDVTDATYLASLGGNQRANLILEAQYHPIHTATTTTTTTTAMGSYHRLSRPTASSSIADRLTFIRAKYEALAFVLPEGPLAMDAWGNIVQQHPEWKGLWGADLLELDCTTPNHPQQQESIRDMLKQSFVQRKSNELPNRLVDYFCTVTPSEFLDPSVTNLTNATSPEDILLSPKVADCFPPADEYEDEEEELPDHIATFVFPEGCCASSVPLPPTFFTLVLTNSTGDRLYGGVLRLYDDDRDTFPTLKETLDQSRCPIHRRPKWLTDESSASCSDVMFMPKCLVILSHYPFFDLWRNFLLHIYRIALTEAPLPIERFVANFGK